MSKVYMQSPGGKFDFVDSSEVPGFVKLGFKPADVRMTMTNGHQYPVQAGRVEHWLNQGATIVNPGEEQPTPSWTATQGENLRAAAASTARGGLSMASMAIPGAGWGPMAGRAALNYIGGTAGDVAGRAIEGAPQDLQQSATAGVLNTVAGLPFEAVGALLPKRSAAMASSALKPSKSQQIAAENAAKATGQHSVPADYERLGRQMLASKVGVGPKAEAKVTGKNLLDTADLEAALTGATGIKIHAATLVRSPEVQELRTQISRETSGDATNKRLNAMLKGFLRQKELSTPRVPSKPTGIVNARGNPVMTKATPATSKPMEPMELRMRQRTMREVSDPIMASRERGESVQPDAALEARMNDALARAAKRITHGLIPETQRLDERLTRRIPLEEAIKDFNRRPPMGLRDATARALHGHLPPRAEAHMALNANDPTFLQRSLLLGRMLGWGTGQVLGQGSKPEPIRNP